MSVDLKIIIDLHLIRKVYFNEEIGEILGVDFNTLKKEGLFVDSLVLHIIHSNILYLNLHGKLLKLLISFVADSHFY